jgi:sugar phosphate isomerase/epimerase
MPAIPLYYNYTKSNSVRRRIGMKLSFSTLGCPGWNLEKIASKAVEYGFDGVELRIGGKQHIDPSMSVGERKAVRKLFEDCNIEICSISGYSHFCSDNEKELNQNMDLLLSNIELAHDLGAPYVRTFIGQYPETMTEDKASEIAAKYLNICGEKAIKKGVKVLIETHDAFGTARQVGKILSIIRNEGVAVLWDIHHTCSGGETPEQTYAILGKLIKHIHMKDAQGDAVCMMGMGNLPIREIIDLLNDKGYKGYLSLEWEKMWIKELEEPEIAFPQYIDYIHKA